MFHPITTIHPFTPELLARPRPRGRDVITTLRDFAIITYVVSPERLRPHIHPRFQLACIPGDDGPLALLSVVPFYDTDFHFVGVPYPRLSFGQTNYRVYVWDTLRGEYAVWFLGTTLDSLSVLIPHYLWKLPWHRGRIRFETDWDENQGRYRQYRMECDTGWAPAVLDVADTGRPVGNCPGFPDLETGLVVLTHPLSGYYYRRDGTLGSYAIWHDRMQLAEGHLRYARFELLTQLNLVSEAEQQAPFGVWLQREIPFTIYLPPRRISDASHEPSSK